MKKRLFVILLCLRILNHRKEPVREIGQVSALIWTGLSYVKTNIGFNDALALYEAVEGI